MAELKESAKNIDSMRAKLAKSAADDIMSNAKDVNGIKVIAARKEDMDMNELIVAAEQIRDKADGALAVLLCGTKEDKISFICMANKAAVEKGVMAGNIIKGVCAITGGSGGGKPDMARGGGKDSSKIDEALAAVCDFIK